MPVVFIRMTQGNFLDKNNLFKFMSLENALKSLEGGYLWLANPTEWTDPFEKRFVTATYIDDAGNKKPFEWKDKLFCACFTQTLRSEAYWSVYSRKNIGIQFTIDRKELLEELNKYCTLNSNFKVYLGKVEYKNAKDIQMNLSDIPIDNKDKITSKDHLKARLLLLKRNDFKYENEIRLIVVKKDSTKENGIKLPIDIHKVIQRITIDPSVGERTTKVLKSYFEGKLGFTPLDRSIGKFYRVTKSNLYKQNQSNVEIHI